jgi:hypothetical protein
MANDAEKTMCARIFIILAMALYDAPLSFGQKADTAAAHH